MTTEKRIKQTVQQGGKEIKRVAPGIIKKTIEDVCETPFPLLGNFGRKKYYQVVKKIKSIISKRKKTELKTKKMNSEKEAKIMYHGCTYRNRNGTRKLINSKVGNICISDGTNELY